MSTDASITRTRWYKSLRSAGDSNCVEVSHLSDGGTEVRHSRNPDGVILAFTADVWVGVLETIAAQRFPVTTDWMRATPERRCAHARYLTGGDVELALSYTDAGESLIFAAGEWDAFVGGVRDGQMAWRPPTAAVAERPVAAGLASAIAVEPSDSSQAAHQSRG